MLVLTLKPADAVRVGDITIKILHSNGNRVELGFSGNRQTPIIREKARKKHGEESPDRD
jgi:sRNA-binding carbon storage regulator CsrA